MRSIRLTLLALIVVMGIPSAHAQTPVEPGRQSSSPRSAVSNSDDLHQLQLDLQRLQVLVNQMRSNLAFVATSDTPLKHQFELQADAWQVVIGEMQRRIDRLQHNDEPTAVH